ncbi:MAG: NAD(P)-binding domain-containing protein, partial [Verrucomicrobiota bacterium]
MSETEPTSSREIDALVIGAGHSGLAVSHCLTEAGVDHVVVERGQVANTWRTERWDSLTLLTPNWQSTLPGFSYSGEDPDGYMSVAELVAFIEAYARTHQASIHTETTVQSVRPDGTGFAVTTDQGRWSA